MKVIDFKTASCKHCYKCVRSCSVKAIRVRDAQAQIMKEYCILCGKCLEVCPQNAKTFVSDLDRVKYYIRSGEKVVISMAPSYMGILSADHPGKVVGALEKLGFQREGVLRRAVKGYGGVVFDDVLFSLLREEWEAVQ